jgi:FkbM family methyltransferase
MFDKPLGGTELMHNEFLKRIPEKLLDEFSIFNYTTKADFSKKLIYWNQLSFDQNAVQFLQQKQNVDRIDYFVFVSNWQAEQFRKIFNIPGEKIHVMKNACIGVEQKKKINNSKKIKICYTSTPWRGLDVLLKAWEILNPQNCELHVFSSCKIYGKDFAQEDTKYEFLYDWCKRLPNVNYRGSIPNEKLRKEISEFDILAYPNTFEETSCISVIEALSAGLRVITSSLGALPETTEGWARMYSYIEDREKHAEVFSNILSEEIDKFRNGELNNHLLLQSEIYGQKWNWDERIKDWIYFLSSIQNPISKYLEPKSILDIGANTGQFFERISNFYPNSKYLLIEANPLCEEDLQKLNVPYKIELLSDVEKEVDFWIDPINSKSTGNSIYKENTNFFKNSKPTKTKAKTLDSIINESYDLIKIDTQGSEVDIIKGGINTIKKSKAVIIEVSIIEYNQGSPLQNEVFELMKSIGFEPVEVLEKIYHPENGQHIQSDILFIKNNN